MPFAYKGGSTGAAAGGNDVSVTHGVTINAGDLVVAYVVGANVNNWIANTGIGDEGAWNTISQQSTIGGTRSAAFWKIAATQEPSAYTFTPIGQTVGTSRGIVKVYSTSSSILTVTSNPGGPTPQANTGIACTAPNLRSYQAGSLSVVFGQRGGSAPGGPYTTATGGYGNVIGATGIFAAAGADQIHSSSGTGTSITITPDSANDNSASIWVNFQEYTGPEVLSSASFADASPLTSRVVPWPSGAGTGSHVLLLTLSSGLNRAIAPTGFTQFYNQDIGSGVTARFFWSADTTSTGTFTLTSASDTLIGITVRVDNTDPTQFAIDFAIGSGDPPLVNVVSAPDDICSLAILATNTNTVLFNPPAFYTAVRDISTAATTQECFLGVANRYIAGATSEDPGPFQFAPVTSSGVTLLLGTPQSGPNVSVEHYRWTDDDNAAHESTTFASAEDTALDVDIATELGVGFNLIFKLANSGTAIETQSFQLQYSKNSGAWTDVPVEAGGGPVGAFSGLDTDGATSVSQRLSASAVTTYGGSYYKETTPLIPLDAAVDTAYEFYYCIDFRAGEQTAGDTYEFRLTVGGTPVTQAVIPTANITSAAVADVDLSHFRWADDDNVAHEATTFLAAEDTALDVDVVTDLGVGFNLVVKLGNEGGATETDDFQLQYNKNGGGWNNVDGTSVPVRMFNGQDTDGATSATERLTTTPETHQGSVYEEVDGLITTDIPNGQSFEFYFCIEFVTGQNVNGDSYQFRILEGVTPITQDVIPSVNIISSAVANVDLAHYRWADDDNVAHEAATFLAAEDTSYEVLQSERGTGLHLVVKLHNDGSAAETENFQLQYNKDGGGWANVNATSNDVRSFNGQDTDGATSATERLSVVPETHIGSVYDEVDGLIVTDIAANNSYEFYFCIEFRTADNLGGESYEFRVLAGAAPITQDFIPAATIESLVELGGVTLVNSEFDPAKIRRLTV